MPVEAPTRTEPIAPARPSPEHQPWREQYTDPERICPQQRRETASPDIAP